jgi:hypothetical protein
MWTDINHSIAQLLPATNEHIAMLALKSSPHVTDALPANNQLRVLTYQVPVTRAIHHLAF